MRPVCLLKLISKQTALETSAIAHEVTGVGCSRQHNIHRCSRFHRAGQSRETHFIMEKSIFHQRVMSYTNIHNAAGCGQCCLVPIMLFQGCIILWACILCWICIMLYSAHSSICLNVQRMIQT